MSDARNVTIVGGGGRDVEIAGRRPNWIVDEEASIGPSVAVRRNQDSMVIETACLGSPPVYMTRDGGRWGVGSSMTAICRAIGGRNIDPDIVARRLCDWWRNPGATIFEEVHRLSPDTAIVVEADGRLQTRADDEEYSGGASVDWHRSRESEPPTRLRNTLTRRIDRLAAAFGEIHVGLSGGVDSSALTAALASRGKRPVVWLLADGEQLREEQRHARGLINQFDLSVHRVSVEQDHLPDHFASVVRHMQGPVINARAVAKYRFFHRVAETSPEVFVSGVGADDLLAGAPNGWTSNQKGVPGFAVGATQARSVGRALLRPEFVHARRARPVDDDFWRLRRRRIDCVTRPLVFPMELDLPASLGIRLAAPFLSAPMVRLARELGRGELIAGRRGKRALRRAVEPWVGRPAAWQPKHPVYAPVGGGNEATRHKWGELFAGMLTRRRLQSLECVCPEAVRSLVDDYHQLELSSARAGPVERVLMHLTSLVILAAASR